VKGAVLEAGNASGLVSPGWDGLAERNHELRAALFGIEASAAGLSEHRDRLTSVQVDELVEGLVAEIRRVKGLVDGHVAPPTSFDLGDAIAPVLACARGAGLQVVASLPRGIMVQGRPDSTAQVMVALLDNARHHAPGSPIEVRAESRCDVATVFVEDRGKGIPSPVPERIFGRGVKGTDSGGSGLGLYIARRVMVEQGGSIGVSARPGGGASFVLRFRRVVDR
jgi:signal transduction histidine kinase